MNKSSLGMIHNFVSSLPDPQAHIRIFPDGVARIINVKKSRGGKNLFTKSNIAANAGIGVPFFSPGEIRDDPKTADGRRFFPDKKKEYIFQNRLEGQGIFENDIIAFFGVNNLHGAGGTANFWAVVGSKMGGNKIPVYFYIVVKKKDNVPGGNFYTLVPRVGEIGIIQAKQGNFSFVFNIFEKKSRFFIMLFCLINYNKFLILIPEQQNVF
jgi:hypothetical protein